MSSEAFPERENPMGDYLLNEEIGSGGFAKVVQGIHIPTGEKVAVKIMDKAQIFSEPLNLNRIQREIAILKIVRHRNIIKLYELMETPNKIYLVMEYCNGGELFDYIVSKQHLTERQACRFFQEIINSVEYLHSLNIVHRDLKPENLLLDKINNKITLKLIDFGISNCYSPEKLLTTPCGTASYAPPEMHRGEEYYGLLSDVWSAGVVLYAMVFGYLPFCEDDEDTNINNIIEGNYEIPEEASPELADLLLHLLDINPLTRYDLEQIKQHPWFNIVKPYKYIPGVIEGYHRIPLDMKIVEACEQYGYDKEKVIESVEKCKYNRNSSVYYIILSKMKREGYHSISDLYSDEFLKYIRNPKNIIYKSEEDINDFNEDNNNNDIKEDAYNDISDRKNGQNKKKIKKHGENSRRINRITRHQSHPIGENNLSLNNLNEDLSFQLKEDENKIVNSKKNKKKEKVEKNEKDDKTEKNEKKDKNEKNKVKNPEQKNIIPPVYKKPKVKTKKNRNEKKGEFTSLEYNNEHNNITISVSNQTHKSNYNISLHDVDNKKGKNNKKEKESIKPKHTKNNRSFSRTNKTKPKKEKKVNNNIKNSYPSISKKPENNALKTEIVRKNMNKKIMPIASFHLISKTKEMLNNNEEVNIDFMNTSFNKKLSDDIKENILKLKNPKKKIPEKEKEKKINNALLSLKMKKQRKKGDYNYNKHYKSKKIKITERPPIFKDNNRKDHTIIHNRNASLCVENRNNRHKNLSAEKNKNRNDFSFSPNINRHESHDRRNIINIYVQNKNNINSNNVYNINLITKNNDSLDKSNINKNKQNYNYNNIKVKKVKMSRQNFKPIEQKFSVNSNNYLNTTNMSFSNRNRKYGFQTPIKSNQGMVFDKVNKIFENSNMQYQSTTNNENRKRTIGRPFSQKSNSIENRYFRNKHMYNKSYNDFYHNNNNKKKIRINFKPIEENEIDDLNYTKKIDIGKINSNQKIKKIASQTNNNKRKNNNNKAYHYKSRSLMDIENPISLKSHPKNNNIFNKESNNNYTITENQKITKIRSTKCASVKAINQNNNYNNNRYTMKQKKPLINISFINLHTNDNRQQNIEPKKYKGPVDLSCLLVSKSINLVIEKISSLLKRYKISNIFAGQYKLKCTKNGQSFDIEIMSLNNNLIKLNDSSGTDSSYEKDSKYKTITENGTTNESDKGANLYYYMIISKVKNNKNMIKSVSKLISTKLGYFKNKK